jgi:hypothetical protein
MVYHFKDSKITRRPSKIRIGPAYSEIESAQNQTDHSTNFQASGCKEVEVVQMLLKLCEYISETAEYENHSVEVCGFEKDEST